MSVGVCGVCGVWESVCVWCVGVCVCVGGVCVVCGQCVLSGRGSVRENEGWCVSEYD